MKRHHLYCASRKGDKAKMKRRMKTAAAAVLMIAFTFLVFFLFQAVLVPKYMSGVREGALIQEYYKETTKHDVIFIGDCEVYENISPVTLWEEYGITSYIRGSAQQLVWQSYYLLEEALKYEKPDVVVFNVLSMKYNEPQNEAYNRMTLDGMKWSLSKAEAVKASMTESENFASYVFPLLRFHSRWSELTKEDFRYMFSKDTVSHNGYLMQVGTKPVTTMPKAEILDNYSFGENAWEYLEKITNICRENGIKLVLMKAPTIYPVWYEQWEKQIEEYADKNDLLYYNFLETMDKAGIDLTTDTYDAGLHLNVEGAEKLSKYFGKILVQECGLSDNRKDEALSEVWREKACAYETEKEKKYRESGQSGNNSERITDK